jgi:S-disulfanyl-L-cysteine oxidoreductase SoxD
MSSGFLAATACLALLAVTAAVGQESRRTIWDGVFSDDQALRGQRAYTQSCARCHADDLLGTSNAPALVGQPFFSRFDRSTADDVVQTIRRTMPQEAPNSLAAEAYVDVVSYLFKANGSPAGAAELTTDRAMLQQVFVTTKEGR